MHHWVSLREHLDQQYRTQHSSWEIWELLTLPYDKLNDINDMNQGRFCAVIQLTWGLKLSIKSVIFEMSIIITMPSCEEWTCNHLQNSRTPGRSHCSGVSFQSLPLCDVVENLNPPFSLWSLSFYSASCYRFLDAVSTQPAKCLPVSFEICSKMSMHSLWNNCSTILEIKYTLNSGL